MTDTDPLDLDGQRWRFLSNAKKYVEVSSGRFVLRCTRRQFCTASDILGRLTGSYGYARQRGILLADDVGLGKTTVAALVAWVFSGHKKRVRILAPNDVMARRWERELKDHIEPLKRLRAPLHNIDLRRVKARTNANMSIGSIQVVKHSHAISTARRRKKLECDLLIVDEAHRAKGEKTLFNQALRWHVKWARRVLFLTATPFGIDVKELQGMLTLVGAEHTKSPVSAFSQSLDRFYKAGDSVRDPVGEGRKLAAKARAAIEALRPVVIRHSIDDLHGELKFFGKRHEWSDLVVRAATSKELELIIRMDRATRIASSPSQTGQNGAAAPIIRRTLDARFDVGWQQFDLARRDLSKAADRMTGVQGKVVRAHLRAIASLRKEVGEEHTKVVDVCNAVQTVLSNGEKVIVFCDHHATAQELTLRLADRIPKLSTKGEPPITTWKAAWDNALDKEARKSGLDRADDPILRDTFIRWLCSDLARAQTWSWISKTKGMSRLSWALQNTRARTHLNTETISGAAWRLFSDLVSSGSSVKVLRMAIKSLSHLPGGGRRASRVLGVCDEYQGRASLFIPNNKPDAVISIFNSPFGPDALVVTDRLSEGVDMHRYCRHLIHHELDPSPVRTVQRNGRIRRVNSWAAVTGEPIMYAYPAFRGTRDEKVVQIMRKRIDSFSLLLGGVREFEPDEVLNSDELWRNDVITAAKAELAKVGRQLCARTSLRQRYI